jgi:two-component system, cell cycle sensor histidine kinase and response regulator CckA
MRETTPAILIVEDEGVAALDLQQSLSQLGYKVAAVVNNGPEAIELAGHIRPHLVLMDIRLPGPLDGIATAREISGRWQIPIVFVTGDTRGTTFQNAQDIGPFGFLSKPYRPTDLRAAVALALDRNRISRALFVEKTWLSTILASLGDGIIATDERALVRYMSPVAEDLTAWSGSDAIGKPIEEVYRIQTLDRRPVEECFLRRALRTQVAVPRSDFLLSARSGRTLFIEDAAAPIIDENGELIGAVTLFLDASERHWAEQEREAMRLELERSNEDLSRFSYSLSHDLQSPVNSVNLLTQSLLNGHEGELNARQLSVLQMISDAAQSMERLIKSMLEFAQFGQGQIRREPVAVKEIIEALKAIIADDIAASGATIRYRDLPIIMADPIQIQQLFQNLISNAIKYRKPDEAPRVSICARTMDRGWTFTVADNGRGIPAESLQRIFEPFKRLHAREVKGTGLGLALCRRIVERHGGRIWAESQGDGYGTKICFEIPRANADSSV